MKTADHKSLAPFVNFAMYSSFQFFKDAGMKVISLMEQHRMHHPGFVKWLSIQSYNGAIIDGCKHKADIQEVKFVRKIFKKLFGVDNSVVMLQLSNTYSAKQDGSMPTVNVGMQTYVEGLLRFINSAIHSEKEITFDKKKCTVAVESTYLGVIDPMKTFIEAEIRNRNFSTHNLQTVQGLGKGVIIRVNPGKVNTIFAGDARDDLVANSRFQYGYIYIVTNTSLNPGSYKPPMKNGSDMLRNPATSGLYSAFLWFRKQKLLVDMTIEDTRPCRSCLRLGHEANVCPEKDAGTNLCENCYELGHTKHKCPMPSLDPGVTTRFDMPCFKCGKPGHITKECTTQVCRRCKAVEDHDTIDCKHPWCREHKTTAHTRENCPSSYCKECQVNGHLMGTTYCPKFEACSKCGGNHLSTACKIKSSDGRDATLGYQYSGSQQAEDILKAEQAFHRQQHPELYEQEQQEDAVGGDDAKGGDDEEFEDPHDISKLLGLTPLARDLLLSVDEDDLDGINDAALATGIKQSMEGTHEAAPTHPVQEAAMLQKQPTIPASTNPQASVHPFGQAQGDVVVYENGAQIDYTKTPLPYGTANSYYKLSNQQHKGVFSSPAQANSGVPTRGEPIVIRVSNYLGDLQPGMSMQDIYNQGWKWMNKEGQQVISWYATFASRDWLMMETGFVYSCADQIQQVLTPDEYEALRLDK
ncbi:hypothetical protein IFR04_002830 [Cadophora malorum]|uniref:CCHC-type domain-containing protein n=1 Tax=Cadophora malorum TaxID=108018 RepID=A0A8H7WFK1_9HELO|nr:hypothetical protein IFR04_002830 [Cadophora malorum]